MCNVTMNVQHCGTIQSLKLVLHKLVFAFRLQKLLVPCICNHVSKGAMAFCVMANIFSSECLIFIFSSFGLGEPEDTVNTGA